MHANSPSRFQHKVLALRRMQQMLHTHLRYAQRQVLHHLVHLATCHILRCDLVQAARSL